MNINLEELKVLLAPGHEAQEEVVRLTAEVAKLKSGQPTPTTYAPDYRDPRILTLLLSVCDAMGKGEKIRTIKLIRDFTGLGLKEVKDLVEGRYEAPGVSLVL